MSDKLLERYTGQRRDGQAEPDQEAEATDDLGSHGWLRGTRDRAMMIELRKKTGDILALPYAWLERAEFNPSEGITLYFGGRKVVIKGQHLNGSPGSKTPLFHGIARHRVPWIQEADQSTRVSAQRNATIAESIVWG